MELTITQDEDSNIDPLEANLTKIMSAQSLLEERNQCYEISEEGPDDPSSTITGTVSEQLGDWGNPLEKEVELDKENRCAVLPDLSQDFVGESSGIPELLNRCEEMKEMASLTMPIPNSPSILGLLNNTISIHCQLVGVPIASVIEVSGQFHLVYGKSNTVSTVDCPTSHLASTTKVNPQPKHNNKKRTEDKNVTTTPPLGARPKQIVKEPIQDVLRISDLDVALTNKTHAISGFDPNTKRLKIGYPPIPDSQAIVTSIDSRSQLDLIGKLARVFTSRPDYRRRLSKIYDLSTISPI
ncbi:phosphoprotein [Lepeophtheirus salmonis rhabdovirus 9]|uniref:Phosphoprotein n=1 Tax=Lepeophtheirus salmonis rhabdovirus 9 TaxID=1573760 RepID=A0A0A1E919_9RHAB|nr:phosphoprotein [Lepeophtheirus salmonis rhabdovirus 9]AIY25908.1 phosphoprotein [Lepeophtheirus salmonis rhabdovirus 9]